MPDADEEVEQHITILSDGRMWISRYSSVEEQLNESSTIETSPSIDFLISTFADKIYILFGSVSIISVTSDINFCKHNLRT